MVGLTPAERRLVLLLLGLALLGSLARESRHLDPKVAAWIDGPEAAPVPPRSVAPVPEAAPDTSLVDPNRGSTEALCSLRGIGPALASRIVAARSQGPYRNPQDLLRVRGIGPAVLARITPRLRFPGPDSSSQDETAPADSADLGQLAP